MRNTVLPIALAAAALAGTAWADSPSAIPSCSSLIGAIQEAKNDPTIFGPDQNERQVASQMNQIFQAGVADCRAGHQADGVTKLLVVAKHMQIPVKTGPQTVIIEQTAELPY